MRTRFRVIDHAEFILIILGCKVETFGRCFFRQTDKKLFQHLSDFLSKRVENWYCISEKEHLNFFKPRTVMMIVLQNLLNLMVFLTFILLILQKKKFSLNQRMIYQHKQLFTSNKQSLRRRNQNKTKTQVTFNSFLNHLYIIQNNLLLLENQVFVKILTGRSTSNFSTFFEW